MSKIIVNPRYLDSRIVTLGLDSDSSFVQIGIPMTDSGAILIPYSRTLQRIEDLGVTLIIPNLDSYFPDGRYNSLPISPHTMVFGFLSNNDAQEQKSQGIKNNIEIELLDELNLTQRFWQGRTKIPMFSKKKEGITSHYMLLDPGNLEARKVIGKASGIEDLLIEN